MLESFQWLTAAVSLCGVWLNINQNKNCFWLWLGGNCSWACIDGYHGIWAQCALQSLYAALSVYGLIKWRAKP